MHIGAHIPTADPLAAAEERGADCVQLFLSNPQSWKRPRQREDAQRLREASLPIYVHAPYLINVASPNNRVRVPSRRILEETCDAAAEIAAAGVIVHGGHVGADGSVEEGLANWRKALERTESTVPILIENTAGGQHAMARHVAMIKRLWEALDGLDVGFCLDTCHAHAAGEPLEGVVDRVLAATGRIDLLHLNDSKDVPGCGRDRHEQLGQGKIDPQALVEIVDAAAAPVICETPGGVAEQAADIRWIRERLEARRRSPARSYRR